jgi:uncharacterized phage-associated protein
MKHHTKNIMNSERINEIIHTMLFVLKELGGQADFHRIFKLIYIADKEHLAEYGTHILDDKYIAMENGPVLSSAYDILKSLRETPDPYASQFLTLLDRYKVKAIQEPDLDELASSHIRFIKKAVKKFGKKGFGYLTDSTHDAAYHSVELNSEMPYLSIAKAGGADKGMLACIQDRLENENAVF